MNRTFLLSARNTSMLLLIILTGCSANSEPIIDTKGVNMTVYEEDLAECKTYADQVNVGEGMGKSAGVGAATGGAVGAIAKDGNIGRGAGIGAVLGASRGGVKASNDKQSVVKRCLRGRGYKVLN
ncbi:MAG: glycine zipper family protein [Gammaproteobacteria bacterium]